MLGLSPKPEGKQSHSLNYFLWTPTAFIGPGYYWRDKDSKETLGDDAEGELRWYTLPWALFHTFYEKFSTHFRILNIPLTNLQTIPIRNSILLGIFSKSSQPGFTDTYHQGAACVSEEGRAHRQSVSDLEPGALSHPGSSLKQNKITSYYLKDHF